MVHTRIQVLYYCCQVVARVNRLSKRLPVLCKIAARHVYQSIGVYTYTCIMRCSMSEVYSYWIFVLSAGRTLKS